MEILPPRRPGQLGAIKAGPGSQGPSGGFSIDSSSRAKSSSRPVSTSQSVSEQYAMDQSTSATVARSTVRDSTGGTYTPGQQVAVRGYTPPPSTPAVTQPAKQPNESAQVKLFANQIPQTKEQQVQQVLAEQAGIAVPLPTPPDTTPQLLADLAKAGVRPWAALYSWIESYKRGDAKNVLASRIDWALQGYTQSIPPKFVVLDLIRRWLAKAPQMQPPTLVATPPAAPGVVGSIEQDEQALFLAVLRATGKEAPQQIREWAALRRRNVSLFDMRSSIGNVVSAAYRGFTPVMNSLKSKASREMGSWLTILEQKTQSIQPVNATTSPNIPVQRPRPQTAPVLTPEVAKKAAQASGAIVGAKVAEQKALQVATVTDLTKVRTQTTAEAKKRADADMAARKKQAEARAKALADAKQKAAVILADQTASEDAKSQAQAELRDAQEAAALAKKQADEAEAQARVLAEQKAKLEADVKALEDAKAKAQAEAQAKAEEAARKQEAAVQAEAEASEPGLVIPFPTNRLQPTPQPVPAQPQPSAGISPLTVGLGVAAALAVVYALRTKSTMNGAPLVVELEENEE